MRVGPERQRSAIRYIRLCRAEYPIVATLVPRTQRLARCGGGRSTKHRARAAQAGARTVEDGECEVNAPVGVARPGHHTGGGADVIPRRTRDGHHGVAGRGQARPVRGPVLCSHRRICPALGEPAGGDERLDACGRGGLAQGNGSQPGASSAPEQGGDRRAPCRRHLHRALSAVAGQHLPVPGRGLRRGRGDARRAGVRESCPGNRRAGRARAVQVGSGRTCVGVLRRTGSRHRRHGRWARSCCTRRWCCGDRWT